MKKKLLGGLLVISVLLALTSGSAWAGLVNGGEVQLTTDLAMDMHPDWSSDRAKIAFHSNRAGNEDVWVMNSDGSNQVQLTTDPSGDRRPYFSPDGTKIVFHSNRAGNEDVWVMNSDGSNQVQLTTDPAIDTHPTWSPDGTKIVFRSNRTGNNDIWMMNADGSSPLQLTTHPAGDMHPFWSPDGTKIAFHSNRAGNEDVWVMNSDGSNQVQLTTDPANDWHADWSPDGSKIAFNSNRAGNNDIWVMNSDGSNQVRLTTNQANDWNPDWSSDRSKIAFQSDRSGNFDIWVMTLLEEMTTPEKLRVLEQSLVDNAIGSGLISSHPTISLPDGTSSCDGTGCHPDSPPWDLTQCNTCHTTWSIHNGLDTTVSHQSATITQDMKVDVHHTIKLVKIEGDGIYFGSLNPLSRRVGTDVFWILVSSNDEYRKQITWTDFTGQDNDNVPPTGPYTIPKTRLTVTVTKTGHPTITSSTGTLDAPDLTANPYGVTPSQFEKVDLNLWINWKDHAGSYTGTITVKAYQV